MELPPALEDLVDIFFDKSLDVIFVAIDFRGLNYDRCTVKDIGAAGLGQPEAFVATNSKRSMCHHFPRLPDTISSNIPHPHHPISPQHHFDRVLRRPLS